jgi:putative transcriptional regulator
MTKTITGSSQPARQTGLKRVVISGANPEWPVGETDWDRLRAMTEEEINAAALSDPDCPPLTDEQLARFKRVNAVKDIRRRLDMTQAQFAETFRLPLSTVRDWEQERSYPDAPARALLTAIARDPETMRRLIGGQAA